MKTQTAAKSDDKKKTAPQAKEKSAGQDAGMVPRTTDGHVVKKKNTKILVILTGGTIGSAVHDHIIDTTKATSAAVIEAYRKVTGRHDEFEVIQPFTVLSENFTLHEWEVLLKTIHTADLKKYKGCIITHGSDTMSYSAALFGELLYGLLPCPVVFISANAPVGEKNSNAVANFRAAVDYINSSESFPGIFAVATNDNKESQLFKGEELMEADGVKGNFTAFGGESFGTIKDGVFVRNPKHQDHCLPIIPDYMRAAFFEHDLTFDGEVMMIRPYVGLNFHNFALTRSTKAVVIYTYHSGTFCTKGDGTALQFFARMCGKAGIPVYLAGGPDAKTARYASETAADGLPITVLSDFSPEAAYAAVILRETARIEY